MDFRVLKRAEAKGVGTPCQGNLRVISSRPMGPTQSSEAIVLRTRAYGESDKIVTFLSLDFGKLTGIAKGAKNSRRRFANCLDPLTRVRVHFRTRLNASLVFMENCDLLAAPTALVEPKRLAYAGYLSELVDQLTGEAHPVPEVFCLLRDALAALDSGPATAAFLRSFEIQLLHHAGYDPALAACAGCDRPMEAGARAYFDPMQGRFLCQTCGGTVTGTLELAARTLLTLESLKRLSLQEARQQRLGATVAGEAARILAYLVEPHLPRPLRSLKLIAALD